MYLKRLPGETDAYGNNVNKIKITFSSEKEYSSIMNSLSAVSRIQANSNYDSLKTDLIEKLQMFLSEAYEANDKTEENRPSCIIQDWTIETIFPLLILLVSEISSGSSDEKLEEVQSSLLELQQKYTSLKETNDSLSKQVNFLSSQSADLQRQLNAAEAEKSDLSAKYNLLRESDTGEDAQKDQTIAQLNSEIESLKANKPETANDVSLVDENSDLKKKYNEIHRKYENLSLNLSNLINQNDLLKAENDRLKKNSNPGTTVEYTNLQNQLNEYKRQNNVLKLTIVKLNAELEKGGFRR